MTVEHSNSPGQRGRRWNPWPVSIAAFFTVVIIGCAGFVFFCTRHPSELVAEDYYEQEVRYQKQMERIQRTGASTVVYEPDTRVISVKVHPVSVSGVAGKIILYRPSARGEDRQFVLAPDASGTQRIDVRQFSAGLWRVRVFWTSDGREYYLDQKVIIESHG